MITYERSAFGLNLLFRINGSATYRSVIPALAGVAVVWAIRKISPEYTAEREVLIDHPYVVGVVVSGITFLIVFRASQGYSRYWEAVSSTYGMMSKWMDATVHTASYHMQSKHYENIKPPSFFDYPQLDREGLTRDRERIRHPANIPTSQQKRQENFPSRHWRKNKNNLQEAQTRSVSRSINVVHSHDASHEELPPNRQYFSASKLPFGNHATRANSMDRSDFLTGPSVLDGNWGRLFEKAGDQSTTYFDKKRPHSIQGFASTQGGRTPPLFLQELAHLSSLLTAVALATLRNDIDGSESPLDYYEPGTEPWPAVDPGDIPELYANSWHKRWNTLLSFLGRGRTPLERTKYNAMRPLPVLGGVSDAEIRMLQMARGPWAKTQLCWHWLSEFIVREHLAGSLGDIGAPIISRVVQFMGDGMMQYNQGRKIMFIPFPFVHAQLSAIFVIVMVLVIPFLMVQYCADFWSASMLTFLSIACLSGIHEVARELENPFRNVPNELPVVTLMAEYNEALLVMYAGYHPDFFWQADHEATTRTKDDDCDKEASSPHEKTPCIPRDSLKTRRMNRNEGYLSGSGSTLENVQEEEMCTDVLDSTSDETPTGESPTNTSVDDSSPLQNQQTTNASRDDDDDENSVSLNVLRSIVLEQGRAMTKMLEEQSRLNAMLEASLQPRASDHCRTKGSTH